MNGLIETLLSGQSSPQREFNSGTMKIYGDIIEFKKKGGKIDRVYRISNISAVVLIEREIPWLLFMLAFASLAVSISIPFLALFGIPCFLAALIALFRYYYSTDKYTLAILLNAGLNASTYIVSLDVAFLRQIAEVLRDIMLNGNARGLKFVINVDRRKVNQIHISGNVTDSNVTAGDNNVVDADDETEFDDTGS